MDGWTEAAVFHSNPKDNVECRMIEEVSPHISAPFSTALGYLPHLVVGGSCVEGQCSLARSSELIWK